MYANTVRKESLVMTNRDEELLQIATERFERRLAEENGKLRVEMVTAIGRVEVGMQAGFGAIRTEMADRNAALLKWALFFAVTQIAAIAGIVALLR